MVSAASTEPAKSRAEQENNAVAIVFFNLTPPFNEKDVVRTHLNKTVKTTKYFNLYKTESLVFAIFSHFFFTYMCDIGEQGRRTGKNDLHFLLIFTGRNRLWLFSREASNIVLLRGTFLAVFGLPLRGIFMARGDILAVCFHCIEKNSETL